MLSDNNDKLLGHIARANPQHSELNDQEVLVTLQGPHDYISPSWYSSPGVPTWNYQAVHIYGTCNVFSDPEKLISIVNTLTNDYESKFEQPWAPDYKSVMLGAIVGIEISIQEIQCKYKLNQNRSLQDRKQVRSELEKQKSWELASAMKDQENDL